MPLKHSEALVVRLEIANLQLRCGRLAVVVYLPVVELHCVRFVSYILPINADQHAKSTDRVDDAHAWGPNSKLR